MDIPSTSVIEHVSRFIHLEEHERAIFLSLLKGKKLRKRHYLLQAGDVCKQECFVVKGCLRAFEVDDTGAEHVAQFAIEDWWIGDMYSFLTETPSRYNIEALEECELLLIDKQDQERLYAEVPKFERFFRIIVQNAFISAQQRALSAISKTAEERYTEFTERYRKIEQRVADHQIGSYLGLTPQTISRIRKMRSLKS